MSTEQTRSLADLRSLLDEPRWPSREKYFVDLVVRMHEILTRVGISQRELATRTGWKESFVSRLLSGDQNPTILTLARFEDAVGHELLTVTSDEAKAGPTAVRNVVSVRLNGAR